MAVFGGIGACLVMPLCGFYIVLYRQDLAMARERLPAAPRFTGKDRLLIVSPHCDDETLGAGGTIAEARAAGAAVQVVFLTNGDGSRSTQIAEDARRLRRNSFQQLARMRQHEAIAALGELGVPEASITFLGYPDGGTQAMWETYWSESTLYRSAYTGADHSPYAGSRTPQAPYCGSQVFKDVTGAIAEFRPTVVLTTHPADTHPDHWAAYAYTSAALESLRLRPATRPWAGHVRLFTFLIHHGLWPVPHGYHPNAQLAPPAALKNVGTRWMQASLSGPARHAKKLALERYVSQLAFTPNYLRGFVRRNELFGAVPIAMADAPTRVLAPPRHQDGSLPVVFDASHDSLLHDVWAAADLQGVTLLTPNLIESALPHGEPSPPAARSAASTIAAVASPALAPSGGSLKLLIKLANGASEHLTYRLSLHAVGAAAARAWKVEVSQQAGAWRAVLIDEGAGAPGHSEPPRAAPLVPLPVPNGVMAPVREIPASEVDGGLQVEIPRAALSLPGEPVALAISASAQLGESRLDETQTGVLRLYSATEPPPRRSHQAGHLEQ